MECTTCGATMEAKGRGKPVCPNYASDARHMVAGALAMKAEVRLLNEEHRKPGPVHH